MKLQNNLWHFPWLSVALWHLLGVLIRRGIRVWQQQSGVCQGNWEKCLMQLENWQMTWGTSEVFMGWAVPHQWDDWTYLAGTGHQALQSESKVGKQQWGLKHSSPRVYTCRKYWNWGDRGLCVLINMWSNTKQQDGWNNGFGTKMPHC